MRAVQNGPNVTATTVIRNMADVEDERVQIDHTLKGSVDRLVRSKRDVICSKVLGEVKVGGNLHVKKLRRYCEERRYDNSWKAHNRREKHIDPHELLTSSMQWQPEIHYGMTTTHNIMNIWRAINAGEITILYRGYVQRM